MSDQKQSEQPKYATPEMAYVIDVMGGEKADDAAYEVVEGRDLR